MELNNTMKLYQSLGVFLITITLVGAIHFQDCDEPLLDSLFIYMCDPSRKKGPSGNLTEEKGPADVNQGSKKAKVDAVTVTECHSDPCILHPGHTYRITITFTPYEDSARTSADTILSSRWFSQHYRAENACNLVKCPVKKGQRESMNVPMKFSPKSPTKLATTWMLFDENKNTMLCVQMNIMVKHERNILQPNFQSDDSLTYLNILNTEYELVRILHISGDNATIY